MALPTKTHLTLSRKCWIIRSLRSFLDSLLTQEVVHSLKMTDAEQEKIATFRKNIAESLRILDEIVEIIRFQDNPEDTIIDQKLEEIRKILSQ